MSDFVLSCCSTADLSLEYLNKRDISFVCFHYNLNGVSYPDDLGQTLPISEFYKKIAEGAQPTTSQVNVEQYFEYFEKFVKEGKEILHLTLSSGISGSVNSARIAAGEISEKYPDSKVIIIDSLAASSGYGLLVSLAADKRDEGKSIDEVAQFVESVKLKIHHWFFSTDLTSYIRGGRVSPVSGWFGTILHICPLLNVSNEGKLIPRQKCRGKAKVIEEIVSKMVEFADNGTDYDSYCYISNSACLDDAKAVKSLVESKFPKLKDKVKIFDIGTVIGAHTGIGTVALFFVGEERKN